MCVRTSSLTSWWRRSLTVSETSSSPMMSMPLLEDDLALVVHHVVVLEDLLADVEVARLDLLLRHLERLVHPRMGDRLAFLQAERLQHAVHALGAEDAHQVVVERQVELGAARVALAAGAAAQLVVDAAALVALGAEHVEAAGLQRLLLLLGDVGLRAARASWRSAPRRARVAGLRLVGDPVLQRVLDVAAELNVGAAAGHVGGDGHRRRARRPGRRCWLPARGSGR